MKKGKKNSNPKVASEVRERDSIFIKGAREHNLKNIDVRIPRDRLVVITGLSGSGKSSLAFDTIYAEGQRRYVESLSSYARQFLEQLQKPDVDYIEGLSPAISIEQRTASGNPRSTVGTQTEIYDYLRLLFARIGIAHCYKCGRQISKQTPQEIVDRIFESPADSALMILAPLVQGRKGEYREIFTQIQKEGFVRARVDGELREVDKAPRLNKKTKHTIEVVIDRIILKRGARKRLTESIETGLRMGRGSVIVNCQGKDMLFSELYACTKCGISYEELAPRNFSFNSPYGACPVCSGLGNKMEIDPDFVVPDKSRPLISAIEPWRRGGKGIILFYRRQLRSLAREYDFDVETPFKALSKKIQKLVLHGEGKGWGHFEGVIPNLERRFRQTDSEYVKLEINKLMSVLSCPECEGARLKKESLAVKIGSKNIEEICSMSIKGLKDFFDQLHLSKEHQMISRQSLKEIRSRLKFMVDVGLDYLTLDRQSGTLSGGEAQRIRLATQIGAGLCGVLYVLDEPSIGLHQKDNEKLLDSLMALRDIGNTLVVVEHDEATIARADHIIDLGPGAGEYGGRIVAEGPLKAILASGESLTGKYLKGDLKIPTPARRRKSDRHIKIIGAAEHNLKEIDVVIPLGLFTCVTGVSGSGKSTLVDEILYRALANRLYGSKEKPGKFKRLENVNLIDKVIVIDQSPIGRTPRSNPATYTGLFAPIRDLFSKLPESRIRGYKPGRFSFNVKGGRCEACQGDGIKRIEMHFMPDVYVKCEVCKGARFNEATLDVQYKGKSIKDVLEMSVEDARALFATIPSINSKLQTLHDVGLGYIRLGQSATTLSGGEAQRVKLSTELSKRSTGRTLYILDEPTTGLHFADIEKLLRVLHRLVDTGNTILVIEHNLEVIKTADHIIDLGPEGGEGGGKVVAAGSPEELIRSKRSYTGAYLRKFLSK
ncbi:MAG: excinuclease ABC subunit UvrA [Candidatus Omnitrophica bacterium]|nr:excinuclease ABC subunit UvrA [Candidatus Omnitrophota bacterium]